MAQQNDDEGKAIWLNGEQRQTFNEFVEHFEEKEGFTPNPGQAVQSACAKALEVEA